MLRNRLHAVSALLLTAVLFPTTPAHATANTLTAKTSTSATKPTPKATVPASRSEQEPSSAELDAQHAQVTRLRAEAARQAADVDDAETALDGAAVLAGQALEEYATAVRDLQVSQQIEQQREDALTQAQHTLDTHRRDLGRWVRQAYANGSGLGSNAALTTLLTADSGTDVATNLTALRRIGRSRGRTVAAVRVTTRRADQASTSAAAASADAADAAVQAANAKDAAEAAVNVQRRLLGVAESSLADTQQDVSAATAREAGLRAALLTPTPAGGTGSTKDNRVTGAVGSCTGGEVQQYPNGQIPTAALCPLRSASGHYLRADAAYAFDRMSAGFADRFGRAICVTDSYRSYAAQVSVYARKPGLAAVPGTSNHGWGTAVDLCGGIQSFTSTEHRWMNVNAPLYGWFHPGWAQQTGSKPEPWHWEYGG